MSRSGHHLDIKKLSFAGVIVTLGIVFGDLGTSPLYVMKAIVKGGSEFNELLIYGGMSCIFWTLTLQTTTKYILITLRADNDGEGGIFSLFALVKKKSTWAAVLTMIGGAALLADGVITPSITVTSSIEGLKLINPDIPVIPIVLIIFGLIFFIQQFGTNFVGGSFGPIMVIWFSMLGILGLNQVIHHPDIFRAVNPVYAYRLLSEYPGGFILLGAVFLCTTGAEALYADLGHCGRHNIRVSWIFVKASLLLNYFGQCSWLIISGPSAADKNPFFAIMPSWFLLPGILVATAASVIASQAIISGSFTIIKEAISLNFWPKIRVIHPTYVQGQVYLPEINWFLWIACSLVVLLFKESSNMEAAYGLSITITEMMTSLLVSYYLFQKGVNHRIIFLFIATFLTIETSFLISNLNKFMNGGWFTILLASCYFLIMFGWYFGHKIKNRFITYSDLDRYLDLFRELQKDESVPRMATNLVYIITADKRDQVESKVIYSIFHTQPKRADTYWLLHINKANEPNRLDYEVSEIIPGLLVRIDFNIGFKVEPRINTYFMEVIDDMAKSGEIKLTSSYESLKRYNFTGDFRFIILDRLMTRDFALSAWDSFVLSLHNIVRRLNISDIRSLNLDSTNTIIEMVPILIDKPVDTRISRMDNFRSNN